MNYELINLSLPSATPMDAPRTCQMSTELFQNARQTMGELRDLLRYTGLSWDFIQHEIDRTKNPNSPIDRALTSMDPYTTGPGRSLRDLPSNIW